jgi:O-antigen/teichoic acid export membrane protein
MPFYARQIGPSGYGLLDATTVILALIGAVVALEISQGLARFLPEAKTQEDRRRIGSTALWFTAVTVGIAALTLGFSARWVSVVVLGAPGHADMVRVAAAAMFTAGLQGVATRHLRWSLRAGAYVAAIAATNLCAAAIGVTLILFWRPAAESLFLGQVGGNLAGLALAWLFARKELDATCDFTVLLRMLRFAAPLVISTLGVIATAQVGRFMLARLGGLDDAGVFGIAARIAGILGLLASGLQNAIGPLIYSAHAKAETPAALSAALRLFAALALIAWMALSACSAEIVTMLAAGPFARAAGLVAPLGCAVMLSASLSFAPGLELKQRTLSVAVISVSAGVANILLCWLLIAPWGLNGAAAAAVAAGTLQAALVFILSKKHYPVNYPWRAIAIAGLLALGVVLACHYNSGHFSFSLPTKLALVSLSSLLILALLLLPLMPERQTSISR